MNTQVIRNFIDGVYVGGTPGATFEDRCPVDNSVHALVHEAGADEVDAAVSASRRALAGPWATSSPEERARVLHKVADGIEARFDDFLRAEIADTGKPRLLAARIDIPRGAANFRIYADLIKNIPTESFPMATPDGAGALNYGHRVPKGVVAVICPWNLPLLLMTWKVGPALACGNVVVVKPSEETPATAALLGEVMNEAGVPKGVYNVVHGFGPGSAGELLVRHPGVDAITFTGETKTGTAIMQAAAVGLRDISLECGGKNPALIFADCDFEAMVEGVGRAIFANCGQVCLNTERVYVERPIFDRFVAAMVEKAKDFQFGNPMDPSTNMGPLISADHRDKVLSYYRLAENDGAQTVTGGGVPKMDGDYAKGAWIEPTIWIGLQESSQVIREEIFGPCCHICPFDDEDEAVLLANDSSYGLATTIWTSDLARGNRLAQRVEVGITWINCWFLRDLRTAFGGAKQSGIGREGGVHSLGFYTEIRNICTKL